MSLLALDISAGYGERQVLGGVRLEMQPGEILGLVGHSGSGKSTLALALLGLLEMRRGWVRGRMEFGGRDLAGLPERAWRKVRGREIALVPQSPLSCLNPALRIGTQLAEAWRAHAAGQAEFRQVLESVSLPGDEEFLRRYPKQLSVGQAQRVLIAMALLHGPALLVADEPTSALDAITQAEVLELFGRINRERNAGILYISHDLLSVACLCHRIGILHEGRIVELGEAGKVFREPQHPYTRSLLAALPRNPYL